MCSESHKTGSTVSLAHLSEFAWLSRSEQRLFSLAPLRLHGDEVEVWKRNGKTSPLVLVASFAGDGVVRKLDSAEPGAVMLAALDLAQETGSNVLVGELAGVRSKPIEQVWKSVARVQCEKANPLGRSAFGRYVKRIAQRLGVVSRREARRLVSEARELLDFDWVRAGEVRWTAVEQGVRALFSSPRSTMIAAQQVDLHEGLSRVIRDVNGAAVRLPELRGTLAAAMRLPDVAAAEAMSRHHGFWVRDRYGRVSTRLAEQVRPVIEQGIRDGLGRQAIGRQLDSMMRNGLEMPGYWKTVSANAVARARSWSLGSSMRAAGITHYRIEAVIDEATTETCRMLHGKVIPLAPAMERLDRVLADRNPEGMLWNQPLVQDTGDELAVEFPDGSRRRLASVTQRGTGTDRIGTYRNQLSGDKLVSSAAIGFPPYHHNCRTTVVPE